MDRIPIVLLILISLAASLTVNCLKNLCSKRYQKSFADVHLYTLVSSVFAAILVLCLSGGFGKISVFTVVTATLFGAACIAQFFSMSMLMKNGSMSFAALMISLSTVIPTFSGALFWEEKIIWLQYIGIALMMVCFILILKTDSDKTKKAGKTELIYALIIFLSTGAIGVLQKFHQSSSHSNELTAFIVLAFTVSAVFSLGCFLLSRDRAGSVSQTLRRPSVLLVLGITGVCIGVNNQLNIYLSGVMDSAVFFPVINGGHLTLVTLFSVTVFRERLTLRQWLGLAFGCAAVLCLCLN